MLNTPLETNVEQKRQPRSKTHLFHLIRFTSFRWMDLPFINGWKNKHLERVGKNRYFTKCVVVAPIQRNGEGDIAAGMIDSFK